MVKMNKQDGVNEMEDYWINGRVDDPVIQLNAKYWGVAEIESHVVCVAPIYNRLNKCICRIFVVMVFS